MSTLGGPKAITSGLIFTLDAADRISYPGTGTSWIDVSGNGRVGTLNNGVTYTNERSGTLVFDGTNDYVSIPFSNALNNCTIEMMFKATSASALVYILGLSNAGSSTNSFQINMNDGSTIYAFWNSDGNPLSYVSKTGSNGSYSDYTDSTWRHYVFTRNTSTTTNHFMNGVQVPNSLVTRVGDQTTQFGGNGFTLNIGTRRQADTFFFVGNIAVVRIYNRELSAAEVQQNYNSLRGRYGI